MTIIQAIRKRFGRNESPSAVLHVLTSEERWLEAHCPAYRYGACDIDRFAGCADRDIDGEVYCGVYRHGVLYDVNGKMIEDEQRNS